MSAGSSSRPVALSAHTENRERQQMREIHLDQLYEALRFEPPEGVEKMVVTIKGEIVTIEYAGVVFGQVGQIKPLTTTYEPVMREVDGKSSGSA
jgi:hypothetical protein